MFDEGDAIIYMKVGKHAQEDLADIIARKQQEIDDEGVAMWGYGGNTCHPTSMVQPFARTRASAGNPILLAMQPMDSNHLAEPLRAEEYSEDGQLWHPVPERINVKGSRYALCIHSLERTNIRLSLASTRVAIGNSKGRAGNQYVRGRVDKACLDIVRGGDEPGVTNIPIGIIAKLVEPYAVFLRS